MESPHFPEEGRQVYKFEDRGVDGTSRSLKDFGFVENWADWRVSHHCILTPCRDGPVASTTPSGRLRCAFPGAGDSLVSAAAEIGFKNVPVYYLRRIFETSEVKLNGWKPVTEVPLVTALVKHFRPGVTEEGLQAAFAARNASAKASELLKKGSVAVEPTPRLVCG